MEYRVRGVIVPYVRTRCVVDQVALPVRLVYCNIMYRVVSHCTALTHSLLHCTALHWAALTVDSCLSNTWFACSYCQSPQLDFALIHAISTCNFNMQLHYLLPAARDSSEVLVDYLNSFLICFSSVFAHVSVSPVYTCSRALGNAMARARQRELHVHYPTIPCSTVLYCTALCIHSRPALVVTSRLATLPAVW